MVVDQPTFLIPNKRLRFRAMINDTSSSQYSNQIPLNGTRFLGQDSGAST